MAYFKIVTVFSGETMVHNPNRDLFFLAQFLLFWKRFDFMDALFEFEPNIANLFQKDCQADEQGFIANEGLLWNAIIEDELSTVQWLLEHQARIDVKYFSSQSRIWACLSLNNTHFHAIVDLLFQYGAGPLLIEKNTVGISSIDSLLLSLNDTPLSRREEKIQTLFVPFLEKCISYLDPSLLLNNLLLRAAEAKSFFIVRWCIEHGADILATDEDGNSILHYWVDGLDEDQDIPHIQDKSLYLELFTFLIQHGADLSYQNPYTGNNALHLAVLFDNTIACQTLLEAGIPIVLNQLGYSPIEIAQNHHRFTMIPFIEKAILQRKIIQAHSPDFLKPRI